MVTIRDVAREAGVSLGTVSNVLNNHPTVSEANKKAVNDAIKKLGYRKNAIASQMRSNVSKTIGLLVPDFMNPFYSEIARGVFDVTRMRGYMVLLCNKDRKKSLEEEMIETLNAKCVDGIYICKPQCSNDRIQTLSSGKPILLFDADPKKYPDCGIVNVDDYTGTTEAIGHIIEHGHHRIGLIYSDDGSFSSHYRIQAFHDSLEAAGIPVEEEYCAKGYFTLEGGMRAFQKLMSLPQPPTAIFATNDMMALGALNEAHKMKINIPNEVSLVGYDDINASNWVTPALTTVHHPKYEVGVQGAFRLINWIEREQKGGSSVNEEVKLLKSEFLDRSSLGDFRKIL